MSSKDTIVYDMSQMGGDSPASIFVQRSNLELQDMMNGNYNGNQIIYDTSTLSNSNKFIDYRDARLSIPLCYSLVATAADSKTAVDLNTEVNRPQVQAAMSMKQTFVHLIHSLQLDWAGTAILQTTPYSSFWQAFQLTTTISMSDIDMNGKTIGFYPNSANFAQMDLSASSVGTGTCNNIYQLGASEYGRVGNEGVAMRSMIQNAFDAAANTGYIEGSKTYQSMYSTGTVDGFSQLRQSYMVFSGNQAMACIQATIRLRDLCDFFNNLPLLKGVFFRLTLNLNQCSAVINISEEGYSCKQSDIVSPLGGCVPFMFAVPNAAKGNYWYSTYDISGIGTTEAMTGKNFTEKYDRIFGYDQDVWSTSSKIKLGLCVGSSPSYANSECTLTSQLNRSTYMYVNAYTFNPIFEQAYLSKPAKTIVYEDIFQFTTARSTPGQQFNFLITNGLSNLKSVLIMPIFDYAGETTTYVKDFPLPYQSPFDTCPDTVSPMVQLTNFNVTVAGANMIYNSVMYPFQQYENHLAGINSINANQTNGLSSGLIDFWKFQNNFNYYYVDCSRMLPVDMSIPKSISISGLNQSSKGVMFYVFCSYGVEITVDILTGARV